MFQAFTYHASAAMGRANQRRNREKDGGVTPVIRVSEYCCEPGIDAPVRYRHIKI